MQCLTWKFHPLKLFLIFTKFAYRYSTVFIYRSSRLEVFCKKCVLRDFPKFVLIPEKINIWRMYCNNVKKGKHCITYTLQLNLTKLNLGRNSSVRRIFQSSVVKTLPCSGCFTACTSAHFPVVKLGYADPMIHCSMVPNEVANSIEIHFTSLRGIEVLAYSFDTNFNYDLFWQ